jgi:hypothetical protein
MKKYLQILIIFLFLIIIIYFSKKIIDINTYQENFKNTDPALLTFLNRKYFCCDPDVKESCCADDILLNDQEDLRKFLKKITYNSANFNKYLKKSSYNAEFTNLRTQLNDKTRLQK